MIKVKIKEYYKEKRAWKMVYLFRHYLFEMEIIWEYKIIMFLETDVWGSYFDDVDIGLGGVFVLEIVVYWVLIWI